MPGGTLEGCQTPATGEDATIWRTAMSRKTTECASATMARLRFVRMENPPIRKTDSSEKCSDQAVTEITDGCLVPRQAQRRSFLCNLFSQRWEGYSFVRSPVIRPHRC